MTKTICARCKFFGNNLRHFDMTYRCTANANWKINYVTGEKSCIFSSLPLCSDKNNIGSCKDFDKHNKFVLGDL